MAAVERSTGSAESGGGEHREGDEGEPSPNAASPKEEPED